MKSVIVNNVNISPSKVICIGMNYAEHIVELNSTPPDNQVIFMKPNSAIADEIYTLEAAAVHYESEISFVITDNALTAVGFGLDLTLREVQSSLKAKGHPWERSKAFDRSAVFSEFIQIPDRIEDLSIELYINNTLTQTGGYDLMLHKPQEILDETAKFLSFDDGDILMTGTPKGVGALIQGDIFLGKILSKGVVILEKQWTVQ